MTTSRTSDSEDADAGAPAQSSPAPSGDGGDDAARAARTQAAIDRYRRLVGNRAPAQAQPSGGSGEDADLARYRAERPPHWAPPPPRLPKR